MIFHADKRNDEKNFARQNEHMIMLFCFEYMIQITDDLRIRHYDLFF